MTKKWNEFEFNNGIDNAKLPLILERFTGTPARLEVKIRTMNPELLTSSEKSAWSINQHVGHISLLEKVWKQRIKEITEDFEEFSGVVISDDEYIQANFNEQSIADIITALKIKRERLYYRILELTENDLNKSTIHPRLKVKMKIIDLLSFICDHDDYHLAEITKIYRSLNESGN